MTAGRLERCFWCNGRNKQASDWEQKVLDGDVWQRLCKRCATVRLKNPYSGLLSMRKVAPQPATTTEG